jgi:hypothetical protein
MLVNIHDYRAQFLRSSIFIMYLGGAEFAWVSDYAQIYFVDAADPRIAGIEDVPAADMERGFHLAPQALVVYTADCLRQHVRVALHDSAPQVSPREIMSEDVWTKVFEVAVTFPSGRFTISSPSKSGGEDYGPVFKAPAKVLRARLSWLEYEADRYDAFRPKPDVIQIELWPG